MVRQITRTTRVLAWALALGLGVVTSATCMLGAEMTEAQHACCAAMNHDCDAAAVQQDCCAADASYFGSVASSTLTSSIAAPVPPTAVISTAAAPAPAPLLTASGPDRGAAAFSRRPAYLLTSVFRL